MHNKKKRTGGSFFSLLVGGTSFMIFYYLLNSGLIVSFSLGVIGFAAAMLFLFPSSPKPPAVNPGEKWASVLHTGAKQLQMIQGLMGSTNDLAFHAKAEAVYLTGTKLMETISKNPGNLCTAEKIVSYYMVTAIKLLERYSELSGLKDNSREIGELLKRIDSALDKLLELFKKQFKNLLADKIYAVEEALAMLDEELDWKDSE